MHKLTRPIFRSTVLIAAALITAAIAYPFANQPKITWSSPGVYAGITSTTTVTKTVTFTSDQPLRGVIVEAVPTIAGFARIQPTTFMQVPAGQSQTVQIIFSAPSGAQLGAYSGTIQVRSGSATLPATLKTSVTYAVVPLPPDPGDAGKTTLAGIDADGDGVRDDVERYIALTYPNSARLRAGLRQWAIAGQAVLLGSGDKANSRLNWSKIFDSDSCIRYVLNNFDSYLAITKKLKQPLLNTGPRLGAWVQASAQESGAVLPVPDATAASCSFNPDVMEN